MLLNGFYIYYIALQLEVPETFMMLALEDGPAPPIKYQCADLGKLHQTVSLLVRSCDVSHLCKSALPVSTIHNFSDSKFVCGCTNDKL